MSEFPSNSRSARPQPPNEPQQRKVDSVVTGEVQTRKKSLGRKFRDLFIGGDSRTVVHYVIMDVLIPQAKDMITEAASQGIEKLIYGESRPGRRMGSRGPGPTNYTRYAVRGNNPIGRSMRDERPSVVSPKSQNIDDILLATRVEAETVLDRLYDILKEYESASVADLYSLVGLSSNFVDQKWGWTELNGSQVRRVRDGYILDLPRPISLD
jgi:hypothetical protein